MAFTNKVFPQFLQVSATRGSPVAGEPEKIDALPDSTSHSVTKAGLFSNCQSWIPHSWQCNLSVASFSLTFATACSANSRCALASLAEAIWKHPLNWLASALPVNRAHPPGAPATAPGYSVVTVSPSPLRAERNGVPGQDGALDARRVLVDARQGSRGRPGCRSRVPRWDE